MQKGNLWAIVSVLVLGSSALGGTALISKLGQVEGFSEGLAPIQVLGRWGFIDAAGKVAIPPRFEGAGQFSHGLAPVLANRDYGFIEHNGEFVIKPSFRSALEFSEGLAVVDIDHGPKYIDAQGRKAIFPFPPLDFACSFKEGMSRFQYKEKWGFLDHAGDRIVQSQYDQASDFSDGRAAVRRGQQWYYIDRQGKEVLRLPADCELASAFSEGVAVIRLRKPSRHDLFIGRAGRDAKLGNYTEARPFAEGLARVMGRKWGYIDHTGDFVITSRFDFAEDFSEGLAMAAVNWGEKLGYINRKGEFQIAPAFEDARPFHESRALVLKDGKATYIDRTGRIVWQSQGDWPPVDIRLSPPWPSWLPPSPVLPWPNGKAQ